MCTQKVTRWVLKACQMYACRNVFTTWPARPTTTKAYTQWLINFPSREIYLFKYRSEVRSLISQKITEIFQRDADILICHTERTEIMLCVCVRGKLEWLSCPRKFIAVINRSHLQKGGRNNPSDWGEWINHKNLHQHGASKCASDCFVNARARR